MIHQYITRSLARKNRGVYFKKGKWILHLASVILIWLSGTVRLNGDQVTSAARSPEILLAGLLIMLPFLTFFYFYCLYLIPYCFKQNRYRKFWTIMVALLATLPLADLALQHVFARYYPLLAAKLAKGSPGSHILEAYWDFIRDFVGYTSILYLMELMEGIRTYREISQNSTELALTERNLIRTRMDPVFLLQSLEGIIQLSEKTATAAPDAVIGFSDILRYRLYRSQDKQVSLHEELYHLEKLFQFSNTLSGQGACTLEVDGPTGTQSLPPLAVVNIAEALINTRSGADKDWSLLLYLLAEDNELQIAAELQTGQDRYTDTIDHIRKNLELVFGRAIIFASERNENTYSIRICLPLYSNASS